MPALSVKDFSCIRSAYLELRPITVVIGPQSSGKSLLAKLNYFFVDAILDVFGGTVDFGPIRSYSRYLEDEFLKNFPPATWGGRLFRLLSIPAISP